MRRYELQVFMGGTRLDADLAKTADDNEMQELFEMLAERIKTAEPGEWVDLMGQATVRADSVTGLAWTAREVDDV